MAVLLRFAALLGAVPLIPPPECDMLCNGLDHCPPSPTGCGGIVCFSKSIAAEFPVGAWPHLTMLFEVGMGTIPCPAGSCDGEWYSLRAALHPLDSDYDNWDWVTIVEHAFVAADGTTPHTGDVALTVHFYDWQYYTNPNDFQFGYSVVWRCTGVNRADPNATYLSCPTRIAPKGTLCLSWLLTPQFEWAADIDDSGAIDEGELSEIMENWGASWDQGDLDYVLAHWGETSPWALQALQADEQPTPSPTEVTFEDDR